MRRPLGLLVFFLGAVLALQAEYPEIRRLERRDPLFRQHQDDLGAWFRFAGRQEADAPGGNRPTLKILQYRLAENDDLFTLSARLNLPYDTLASLNSLGSLEALRGREILLIPNLPGIFVPHRPESDFEWVVHTVRASGASAGQQLSLRLDGRVRVFTFLADERFHPLERAYFLRILFRLPIPAGSLSSGYGQRPNPFTGHEEFHHGIDIAAPEGTEVLAARGGEIVARGIHPVLGRFLQIRHDGGYYTVYGHLSRWEVGLKQKVTSGMIIGRVGSTGVSTGPHLHFEIRRQGTPQDPLLLFPEGKDGWL